MSKPSETFRNRLRNSELLVGTFVKTPSSIVAEVLARSKLDLHCIDAEHAPFGRLETDHCVAAFRSAGIPVLVRVPSDSPHDIRNALDSGATGILVPHVTGAEQAQAIVKAAHYGDGGRGYAGSTRAAEFSSKSMPNHLADSREQTTVIVQIEDIAALDHVAEIAAVEGVDALFVGRIDLAVAMGKPVLDKAVITAVRTVCDAAKSAGTALGMFTPDFAEIPGWIESGASLFILGSDQGFILSGANALAERVRR
jgi:2-keto-3-deoxy-L-rhamnonate aldolase RhmA